MTYIYDTAYLNVRRFHFILIVIKMYDGDAEVFDSRTKEPILYKSAFDMLKR
jgi:hypothetical protein